MEPEKKTITKKTRVSKKSKIIVEPVVEPVVEPEIIV